MGSRAASSCTKEGCRSWLQEQPFYALIYFSQPRSGVMFLAVRNHVSVSLACFLHVQILDVVFIYGTRG